MRRALARLVTTGGWLLASAGLAVAAQAQVPNAVPPGPLSKAHAALEGPANCQKCHDAEKSVAADRCLSCHKPIAQRIAARRGVHREVTGDCAMCHAEHAGADVDLRPLEVKTFDHAAETGFALTGRHAALAAACARCHTTRSFLNNRPECSSCHTDRHNGAMGSACQTCHTPDGWAIVSRAFHKAGQFPLQGKHLAVPCASCHLNGVVKGTPTQCYACHWERRRDDRYQTRLGSQCESCHTPVSWTAVRWNHAAASGVSLNAQHRTLACDSCHTGQVFRRGSVACASCHREDYERAQSPNHKAAGFPLQCDLCHRASDSRFAGATFAHASAFPLVGVHATQPCAACHRNNVFKGTPRDCIGCHQADYQRAQNPNHAAAGFPTACEACHRPSDPSFKGASFNHAATYALVGVHATQACSACHRNGVYKGTPRDCVACHQADYQRTQNPNHAQAGFPTTCEACHRPSDPSFKGGSFNHASVFALVGVHATQACSACHRNGVYKGTPRDCVACHLADYQRTQNPNHGQAGFPTNCDACHRPSDPSFKGASFNHASVFALVGVHATRPCAACHGNGVYKGTPRTCFGCHQADYQRTQNPNHVAAGFPTTCDSCHRASDASFRGATFNHVWFPISSGRHAGNPCSACHTDANNYKVFSCLTCHGRSQTDSKHAGRAGYRYDSQACYTCHPQGRG